MKTRPFTKIKPSDIDNMLKLKNDGWSFSKIGRKYKLHHTTVMHHLKRLGRNYFKNKRGAKVGTGIKKQKYYKKLVLEPKNTYKDYCRIEEERKKRYTQNKHLFFI